jgi:predicted aspartyl protease
MTGRAVVKTEVPFRLSGPHQPLILVDALADGLGPFPFVLDTGAGLCLITPELAGRLTIRNVGSQTATGAGGPVEVQTGVLGRLALEEAVRRNIPVAITSELHRIGAAIGADLQGNIGHSFLRHYCVTLDYHREVLVLSEPDSADGPSAAGLIPFTLAHPDKPLVLVSALVNGRGPFPFAIDTGTSTTLIRPGLAARLGVSLSPGSPMTGGGGAIASSNGVAASFQIGEAIVTDLEVMAVGFLEMISAVIGTPLDGIVGLNFLKRFAVTIDYPRSGLRLEWPL